MPTFLGFFKDDRLNIPQSTMQFELEEMFLEVLGIKPRISYILGKFSTT